MFDNVKVDLNQISWYLWVVVVAAVFSVFSLKYNTEYIKVGFVTFAFGVSGHIIARTFDRIFANKVNEKPWLQSFLLVIEVLIVLLWVYYVNKVI